MVSVEKDRAQITLKKSAASKDPPKTFTFDAVFPHDTAQRTIYEESVFALVESVLEGYNGRSWALSLLGTIFAYGQTGCGKTYTMVGAGHLDPAKDTVEQRGIIPNAFTHIFGSVSTFGSEKRSLLRCSYLEIYNESIHDLLDYDHNKKLELKEDTQKGIYVKGLTTVIVRSVTDIERTMNNGSANRHTAETAMNKDSSRSHCIFTIYIETAEKQPDGNERIRAGKLNLVDLAGSERQSKTHAEGQRLVEATKINLSLSALGNVISALVDGKSSHIPYRDSKLTRLLQDSLGGNTKTVMIACVSPAGMNYDETLSTLRYASSAKHIKNKPHINEDPKDALLRQYEQEITQLRNMLKQLEQGGAVADQLAALGSAQLSNKLNHAVMSIEELERSGKGEELKRLEEEKAILSKDKESIANQLKEKEKEFISEVEQRAKMEEMITKLEEQLVVGGREIEEREKEQARKQREMQEQLRKQRQKEKRLLEEQQKKEAEIQEVEHNYLSVQEELLMKNKAVEDLSGKYQAAKAEIEDLHKEHQGEKETLLDTIREQTQELELYRRIIDIMMSEGELDKVKSKATWDDELNTWNVPLFLVQNKQVMLPRLPKTQGKTPSHPQL